MNFKKLTSAQLFLIGVLSLFSLVYFSFSPYISADGLSQLKGPLADAEIGTAEGANFWTPSLAEIEVGDTITFTNTGLGFHNLAFDGGVVDGLVPSGFVIDPPSSSEWSKSVTFDEPGTYYFYCDPHFNLATKEGMGGRIVVSEPTSGTLPTRTPTPDSGTLPTRTPMPTVTATPAVSESQEIYLPVMTK